MSDESQRRCTICGHVVDLSYEAEKPTVQAATAWRDPHLDGTLAQARAITTLRAQLSAAEAQAGVMAAALDRVDRVWARDYWTSDDGKNRREGSPDDDEVPTTTADAWKAVRAALSTLPASTKRAAAVLAAYEAGEPVRVYSVRLQEQLAELEPATVRIISDVDQQGKAG